MASRNLSIVKRACAFALLAGVGLGVGGSQAQAGLFNYLAMGGLNDTLSSGGGVGFDVGVGFSIAPPLVSIELDGLYLSQAFTGFSNTNSILVPLTVYYPLLPMVSLGAGGWLDFGVSTGSQTNEGLHLALRISVPAIPVFVEGRMLFGLANVASAASGTTYHTTDGELNVGVSF